MKFNNPLSVNEVAGHLNAECAGDTSIMVTGINEIHLVEPGDITFVDHPKYYRKVLGSKASVIIINQRLDPPDGKALIYSDDPFTAYVSLVMRHRHFEPATALISPSAKIGKGTVIQPGAFVGNHVTIGENCIVHANASIYDHCILGNNVILHSGSVIGADAFYYKKRDGRLDKLQSCGRVILHDNVEIGACSTVDKGVSGDTTIGAHTKLDNHVQVGHDTVIGKCCIISSHVAIAGVTTIEDDVTIWGQCAIQKDLVVGKGSVLLAKSAIDKSMPPGVTYFGIPARDARTVWKEISYARRLPEIIAMLGLDQAKHKSNETGETA